MCVSFVLRADTRVIPLLTIFNFAFLLYLVLGHRLLCGSVVRLKDRPLSSLERDCVKQGIGNVVAERLLIHW